MLASAALLLIATTGNAEPSDPVVLPTPARVEAALGEGFLLNANTVLSSGGDQAATANAAARLGELMRAAGVRTSSAKRPGAPLIQFVQQPGLPPEGYRLETSAHGATITASDGAGLVYGAVTLWQLATRNAQHHVPALVITDKPRFGWRGLMLDSARHMQSPDFVRKLIDWMAANKLNRLHWHLVDDQGWRIEIKRYPRLTDVSAWRRPASAPEAPALPRTGGFYTQAQIRTLVSYAQQRGVTIVPEIEMPGHATAAIRAYPELGTGVSIPEDVWSSWGIFPWLYNVDEPTFSFLTNVLDEVMALFPSRWIHLGGDEAVKQQWRANSAVQAKMRAQGIKDEEALQGWFMSRMGRYLTDHGRTMIGWDEILAGDIPQNAVIMSWRGTDGAIAAAKSGRDTILSPAPVLYLNHRQSDDPSEPPGRGPVITLRDVLAFDPVPDAITPDQRRHVIGVQGNLWTEHARTDARAAWMLFPRALAVSELGWAQSKHDYPAFIPKMVAQLNRMRGLGLEPADNVFAVEAALRPSDDAVLVTLNNQAGRPVHFTVDGSAPGPTSRLYERPFKLTTPTRLRAVTVEDGLTLPGALDRQVDAATARQRTSTELEACQPDSTLYLEDDWPADGTRAKFLVNPRRPCWIWTGAPTRGATAIAISVGRLPYNFQYVPDHVGDTAGNHIKAADVLEVRTTSCQAPIVATVPLDAAVRNPGVTRLTAPLVLPGNATLCLTTRSRDPRAFWAIESVALLAGRQEPDSSSKRAAIWSKGGR